MDMAGKIAYSREGKMYITDFTFNDISKNAANNKTTDIYLIYGDDYILSSGRSGDPTTINVFGINLNDGSMAAGVNMYNPNNTETNAYSQACINLTVKNLKIIGQEEDANGDARHGAGFYHPVSLLVEDCVFTKSQCIWNYGENYTVKNCVFNCQDLGDKYAMWTRGNGTWNFEGCTFNTNGKAIKIYGTTGTINVLDCTFNVTDKAAKKAAVQNDTAGVVEVNIKGCTNNGHEGGICNK